MFAIKIFNSIILWSVSMHFSSLIQLFSFSLFLALLLTLSLSLLYPLNSLSQVDHIVGDLWVELYSSSFMRQQLLGHTMVPLYSIRHSNKVNSRQIRYNTVEITTIISHKVFLFHNSSILNQFFKGSLIQYIEVNTCFCLWPLTVLFSFMVLHKLSLWSSVI